jgi:hypothetical protein
VIVILLLLLTAMLHDEGKGWAAREGAAGSVLHAIDVGVKGQAIRTSINPGKSSCKKHLTWYTKSCCFRRKRTWHRLTQCLYMSIRIVFYNRIAPVFSRSLLDLFRQACNVYIYIMKYYPISIRNGIWLWGPVMMWEHEPQIFRIENVVRYGIE